MKLLLKYTIIWITISLVGGILVYFLYPFFADKNDHTNYFKSA